MKIISDLSVSGRLHRPRSGLPQPSLRLDFITGAYHPGGFGAGLSFTRAGAARYFDAAGVMQLAAADQPRFDFDPATLAPRGLLLEPARTNLLLYSANYAVVPWYRSLVTVEAAAGLAPDGSNSATKFISAGGAYPQLWQTVTTTAGQPYIWSIWVKSDGTPQIAQTLIHDGVSISFTPTATWQRIVLTKPASSGGTRTVVLTTNSPAAPASSFLIWGAQFELGAAASSYIPTTTAAVTRAADLCTLTLGGWWNAAEGTLLVEWQDINQQAGNSQIIGMAGGRSVMNLSASSGQNNALGLGMYNGTAGLNTAAAADITKGVQRGVAAWSASGRALAVRNTLATAVTPLWDAGTPAVFYLGHDGAGMQPNGCLRRIIYYPKRLSDAQVLALVPV